MKPEGKAVARREDYLVREVRTKEAGEVIARWHYARSSSNCARSFGLIRRDGGAGELVGAVQFLPPLPPAARKVAALAAAQGRRVPADRVVALSRLAIAPDEPQNAASILVGAALRTLKLERRWCAVVTFADTSAGHTGRVYRALNAEPAGMTKPEPYWIDPATGGRVSRKATHSRTKAQMSALGLEQRMSEGKYRFVWWLGEGQP